MADPRLHPSWLRHLAPEFQEPYIDSLRSFLTEEKRAARVFPPGPEIFNAFNLTPLEQVRVVILGQDPYIRPGQAQGLCFSVRRPTPPPPSLQNIFKELQADVGFTLPDHGDLTPWAQQGVLLLNSVLTVREGVSFSHANRGWERFTDRAIELVAAERSRVVFLLWGRPAQEKAGRIDRTRHHVLMCAHPSPMSATRGFFGCRHFSKTNALLKADGAAGIDWQI